jgi:hypothetical protein
MRNALPSLLDALDAAEAERNALRTKLEDRNGKILSALFVAEPMECGHPNDCLPDHTAQEAREHIERIVCGWCVANGERDEARADLVEMEKSRVQLFEEAEEARRELAEWKAVGAIGTRERTEEPTT